MTLTYDTDVVLPNILISVARWKEVVLVVNVGKLHAQQDDDDDGRFEFSQNLMITLRNSKALINTSRVI